MKVTVTEDLGIQLEEVFSGLTLKTESGETMSICMRDSGFEFNYQGEWYFAKEGYVEPFHKSVRDNYLVSELQRHDHNLDADAMRFCQDTTKAWNWQPIEELTHDNLVWLTDFENIWLGCKIESDADGYWCWATKELDPLEIDEGRITTNAYLDDINPTHFHELPIIPKP